MQSYFVSRFAPWFSMTTMSLAFVVAGGVLFADDPPVKFDVPSLVSVHELEFAEGHESARSPNLKIVEVVIPVSTEIGFRDRENIDEFRFDVYWNRNVYPIDNYSPRTQTVSDVEGLIAVEKGTDTSAGVGFNLKGSVEAFSGNAEADLSQRTTTKLRYSEVPQHEVLVASGTIRRGTGAFFRFHPSKRETLEGGRDLIVAFRVPQSWRGGVIKVECRAAGHRKIMGSWREPFEENRAFVLPIYLEGDDQARQAAEAFVRKEQGLRRNWQSHQKQARPQPVGLFSLTGRPAASGSSLPSEWVHHLIQSGNDSYLNRYREKIPSNVVDAAEQFVAARKELFAFSR
ncbi:MAG: hypothetical protein ACI87E_003564 [Mariniblastus sp.]|jgi:hypothetical protein